MLGVKKNKFQIKKTNLEKIFMQKIGTFFVMNGFLMILNFFFWLNLGKI